MGPNEQNKLERFLKIKEVEVVTGLKRSTIYSSIKESKFPSPVRISTRAVAWREKDIIGWQVEKIGLSNY